MDPYQSFLLVIILQVRSSYRAGELFVKTMVRDKVTSTAGTSYWFLAIVDFPLDGSWLTSWPQIGKREQYVLGQMTVMVVLIYYRV